MVHVLMMLAACSGSGEVAEVPEAPEADEISDQADPAADAAALASATDAVVLLGKSLKTRLTKAMSEDGAVEAARVCSEEAQGLTAQVRGETGVQVGRASLKLRNPVNGGPEWVRAWLTEQEGKPAAEVQGMSLVVSTPEGRKARVIRPIAVDAPCLSCHGPEEALSAEAKALLDERYPKDAARGYAVGDLRGAMWGEALVKSGS